eukprot:8185631-Karenia_brevis.AAC.1
MPTGYEHMPHTIIIHSTTYIPIIPQWARQGSSQPMKQMATPLEHKLTQAWADARDQLANPTGTRPVQ